MPERKANTHYSLKTELLEKFRGRIAGVWKSNGELTLKNMEKAQLTEKRRKLFSKNFFGKLVLDYTCKGFTSTFEGKVDTYQFLSMSESGDTVTTEYYDPFNKQNLKRTASFESNCYSIPLEHLGFDEIFCRVRYLAVRTDARYKAQCFLPFP